MNHLNRIKQRLKGAGRKVAVASTAAGAALVVAADSVFAAIDTSSTGEIATSITSTKTDYEAVFVLIVGALVVFWGLGQLKKLFFSR